MRLLLFLVLIRLLAQGVEAGDAPWGVTSYRGIEEWIGRYFSHLPPEEQEEVREYVYSLEYHSGESDASDDEGSYSYYDSTSDDESSFFSSDDSTSEDSEFSDSDSESEESSEEDPEDSEEDDPEEGSEGVLHGVGWFLKQRGSQKSHATDEDPVVNDMP